MKQPPKNSKAKPKQDSDVEKMLARIEEMKRELESKLAGVYEEGRKKNINVDKFFGDISKLSPQHLQQLKDLYKSLVEQLKKITPPDSCINVAPRQKSIEKLTQERKSKTLGARKKWIPIK